MARSAAAWARSAFPRLRATSITAWSIRAASIGLQVTLLGDFNNDGMVGNADYVVWRKGLGTTYTPADYDVWRTHYGETPNAGPGAGAGGAIPEPTSVALLLIGWLPLCCRRRVRR